MKTTKWRKPVGDCGGINELVYNEYMRQEEYGVACYVQTILHAYREVGTSLECALEVQYYTIKKVCGEWKRIINHVKFINWVC